MSSNPLGSSLIRTLDLLLSKSYCCQRILPTVVQQTLATCGGELVGENDAMSKVQLDLMVIAMFSVLGFGFESLEHNIVSVIDGVACTMQKSPFSLV